MTRETAIAVLRPPIKTPFFYGWLIVVVAAMMTFSEVTFLQPIMSVFMLPLNAEFGWSRSTIAGAIGLGSFLGAFITPFVGIVLDKWGGRWVMAITGLMMAVCLFLLAGIQSLLLFYVFYIIGRTAVVSIAGLATSVTVSNWFIRNRGPAIGYMNFGTRGGQAVLPALSALIIVAYGWRSAFVVLAVIVLILAVVPSLLFVRRRPEDVGLEPDGMPRPVAEAKGGAEIEADWTTHNAIRTRTFWLLTFTTSISFFAHSAIHLHLVPYLQDSGLSATSAVTALSVLSIAGGVGGLLGGYVERRYGSRRTLIFSLTGHAIAMLLLLNVHSLIHAYGFALYYGIVNGTTLTLNSMIFATYFGRRSLGTIRGIASPIQLIFNATGPFLGGLTYDVTGSYSIAFIAFALLYVLGAICMFFVNRPTPPPVPVAGI
jgi:MFS family permease